MTGAGAVPRGGARDALERVAARTFALLWVTGATYAVVFIVVWWSWYGHCESRLVGPVVAVIWDGIFIAASSRGRVPGWCVAGEVALGISAAASARAWLPGLVLSEANTWVFLTVVGAVLVAAWCVRSRWWWLIPVVAGVVFAAGTTTKYAFHLGVSEALIVFAAGAVRFAGRRLRRNADDADGWLGRARERQRRAAVVAARDRDRREQERVLHDTVLNTFTGIGWGGAALQLAQTRARCARGADALRAMVAGGPANPAGLALRVEEAVAGATEAGVDVALSPGPVDQPEGEVPAEVGAAVAAALGEVLANVRLHAGTMSARVAVSRPDGGGVRVEVRDEGVGFDPGRRPPDRLGLRESVSGRLAEVGGRAEIRSRPGAGTTVVLGWRPSVPAEAARRGRELSATAGRLRRDYAAGLRRTVASVAAVWLVALLLPLAASWDRYPRPWVALAAWLLLAGAVTSAVRISRGRALNRPEATALVLVAVVGALVMGGFGTRSQDVTSVINWYGVQGVTVLLILVAASRPAREWVVGAVFTDGVVLAVAVTRAGTEPVALTRLFAGSYGLWTLLIMVAAMGPVLLSTAAATTQAAAAEAEHLSHQESARAVHRDRRRRHQHLEAETLPLLRGIASGTLDPRAAIVRRACVVQATLLRRRLATSAQPGYLDRLETAIEAAEARGVSVHAQLAGDLIDVPVAVRTEIVDAVGEALDAVPDGPALLTVWCTAGGGSAYVSFPANQATDPLTRRATLNRTGLTTAHFQIDDGQACLEVQW